MPITSPPRYHLAVGQHYYPRDVVLGNHPHPARPPYLRRQLHRHGVNPHVDSVWPTPGARVAWWLCFRQEAMPIESGNFFQFVTHLWITEAWQVEDQGDGGPAVHGGAPDYWIDVAILSTDTAVQVAAKTYAALQAQAAIWSNYRPGNIQLINVTAGSHLAARGLPVGPAILWQDPQLRATTTAGPAEHEVKVGIFTHGGPPLTHPDMPVVWYPLASVLGADQEGMLSYGQNPVWTLPARWGYSRAVLPIGDLPNAREVYPRPL